MMHVTIAALLVTLCAHAHALSIGTVSEKSVKRDSDFYPDWVPFKNKKGDQLGEFVQVKKSRPAKRLAPPVNFVLRAVAEQEGDDYFEKGQGDGDGEDYFEKKEWSDTYRAAKQAAPVKVANASEVSDIDGIVNIIISEKRPTIDIPLPTSKPETDTLVSSGEESRQTKDIAEFIPQHTQKEEVKPESNESEQKDKDERQDEISETVPREDQEIKRETTEEDTSVSPKPKEQPKEYNDYDEESAEKGKPEQTEEEKQAAEAKKARILGLVDDLKRRHEKEQREISERAKEDEIIKEDRERELNRGRDIHSDENDDGYDKYNTKNTGRSTPFYEDYEEPTSNYNDKYKIHFPTKKPQPTTTSTPMTSSSEITETRKRKKSKSTPNKHEESGKLSVFKNPNLYMMYEDDISAEVTTAAPRPKTKPRKVKTRKTERTTIKSTTPAAMTSNDSNEGGRISLVPEDNEVKDGEPTLFFPQKRKNKRKRKNRPKLTTPEPDSFVAESVNDLSKGITSVDSGSAPSGPDSTADTKSVLPSDVLSEVNATPAVAADFEPSAEMTALTAPSAVSDTLTAASGHKEPKHHPKNHNYHKESGAEKEHYGEYESEHGEDGKKAYEGVHKDTKIEKGHHDKEKHHGAYDDHGGYNKEHHSASDHYGAHHHEEHGKKHAKYEESGKHSKGHSTKGSHDIHKKEEYEKKVEFFEEEGDSAEEEKHGGHTHERAHSSGGHFKHGKSAGGHHDHAKGESGHFEKGGHLLKHQGHKAAAGHDSHGKHGSDHAHKGGNASGKKWIYHHGSPAKTANLVVIDRRADQYYHGPQYFG